MLSSLKLYRLLQKAAGEINNLAVALEAEKVSKEDATRKAEAIADALKREVTE